MSDSLNSSERRGRPAHGDVPTARTDRGDPRDLRAARANSFSWRVGAIFLSLAVLYGLYALQALDNFSASVSMPRRLIMTAASASVALAMLVPVATFAAALHRFDLFDETTLGSRRRDWTLLALAGLGSYVSSTIGPLASAAGTFSDRPVAGIAAMILVPVAIGIFSIVAGIAGALVGQLTEWMIPWRRQVARWAACLALLFFFCAAVVAVDALVARHGWPVAWLFVPGPLAVPAAATWIMLRVQGYRVRDMLPVPAAGTRRRPLGPEALDRLATTVARADWELAAPVVKGKAEAGQPRTASGHESEMAAFLSGLRRVALPDLKVSDAQVEKIVHAVVAAAPDSSPASEPSSQRLVARQRRLDLATVAELGVSWASLAVGLVLLGAVGGVPPNIGAAAGIGLLGSVAGVWIARRRLSLSSPTTTI